MTKVVNKIIVSGVLWGGKQKFNHGKQEPWIGVAESKLKWLEGKRADIEVTGLKTSPVYYQVNIKTFLRRSEAKEWFNFVGKHKTKINYLPQSELKEIARKVRE